jgi:hypothetical protein
MTQSECNKKLDTKINIFLLLMNEVCIFLYMFMIQSERNKTEFDKVQVIRMKVDELSNKIQDKYEELVIEQD